MSDPSWMLFVLLVVLLVILILVTSLVIWVILRLLRDQQRENQKLRNLLMSRSVAELAGLNHATGVSQSSSNPVEVEDLIMESIDLEEQLAKNGYEIGDLNGLEAYGWSSPVTKRGDGDPIAFDS